MFRGKLDLSSEADALLRVAEAMAGEYKLLCFDEFQVTDVADALLMNKLFRTLLSRGTVVVATSNRPIDDLYAGAQSCLCSVLRGIRPVCVACVACVPGERRCDVRHHVSGFGFLVGSLCR